MDKSKMIIYGIIALSISVVAVILYLFLNLDMSIPDIHAQRKES